MRRLLAHACALAALGVGLAVPAFAQDFTVPKKYQLLYQGLDAQVGAFAKRLPAGPAARPLRRAALLTSMRCELGPDLLSAARRDAAILELDALRRVGAQAIVLEACYPLLTPAFQDPRPLLEQLANLANQVRLREMALLIDHRILPDSSAPIQATHYYRRMARQRFFGELGEEAKALAIALQPEYLTLISDPQAPAAGLRLTPRQWRTHLQAFTTQLRADLGDFAPALGAGGGLWSDAAFIEAFAAVPGLAYIDLRFYPLVAGQEGMLERVLSWPDRIRAIDPAKRIVLSHAWLSKATDKEPFTGRVGADALAREGFAFWAPLDAKFLRALAYASRVKDIELLGVSRPRYLFAYLDFFDPATFRASARLLDELANQRAVSAMQMGGLSEAGRAFGAL
jgi:hypothetical protein